jgi:RNA polymerase sigma factor (sigma-70 family)
LVAPWALTPARLAGSRLLRTQTDARLVDLVRAGNDRAFEAIVLRHQRSLLRHCRRLLPASRAEDAVQQTLLRALEAMRADDREIRLGPWLHRILHNTAIDSLRRLDSHWEELDEHMDGVEPTHAAVERRARFRSVVAGVGSLPERQRRALVLRELEGRSYDEIAADLGVSGAGVRQLLNRARNAMRAGASALMPPALVGRLAGSKAGATVAELGDPPGTSALAAKATAAVAAGALALLAVSGTPAGDRAQLPQAEAGTGPPRLEHRADRGGRSGSGASAAPADPAGHRTASLDRPRGPTVDAGRGSRSQAFSRQPAGAGRGRAGEGPLERDAPATAPRRRSASLGGGQARGGDDDPSGGSPGEQIPVVSAAMEDDGGVASGDDGEPEDDTPVAGYQPPDEGADDDAPAPAGVQAAASPADADPDEDDDEDSAGD